MTGDIAAALGAGNSYEEVQDAYAVTREQILTALRYAAHVAAHQPPAVQASCRFSSRTTFRCRCTAGFARRATTPSTSLRSEFGLRPQAEAASPRGASLAI